MYYRPTSIIQLINVACPLIEFGSYSICCGVGFTGDREGTYVDAYT